MGNECALKRVRIRCRLIFFFQAEDGIRDRNVTGVQTCALPIYFSIVANPNSVTILRGSLGLVNVTLSSIGGFNGTISMTGSITPTVSGGPTIILSPSTVLLASGGTAVSVLQILTNSTTALGAYNYTVTGTSGSLFHSAVGSLSITTSSSGDFSLFTSPSSIMTTQNSTRSFGVIALSLNGFAGNVSISTSNLPSGVAVQFL